MLAGKISALKYFPNCFWDSAPGGHRSGRVHHQHLWRAALDQKPPAGLHGRPSHLPGVHGGYDKPTLVGSVFDLCYWRKIVNNYKLCKITAAVMTALFSYDVGAIWSTEPTTASRLTLAKKFALFLRIPDNMDSHASWSHLRAQGRPPWWLLTWQM